MKKLLLIALTAVASLHASDDWYMRGTAGVNFLNFAEDYDEAYKTQAGYFFAATLGNHLGRSLRIEGEAGLRDNTFTTVEHVPTGDSLPLKGHLTSLTLMGNAVVDCHWVGFFRPYVGMGIGARQVQGYFISEAGDALFDKNMGAYQVIVGTTVLPFEEGDLRFEYRYLENFTQEDSNHAIALALKHAF